MARRIYVVDGTSKDELTIGLDDRRVSFRTNAGILEFKDNNGTYYPIQPIITGLTDIDSTDTSTLDFISLSSFKSMQWHVEITDDNSTVAYIIRATKASSTSISMQFYGIIGDISDITGISVDIDGSLVKLNITNNTAGTVTVGSKRML